MDLITEQMKMSEERLAELENAACFPAGHRGRLPLHFDQDGIVWLRYLTAERTYAKAKDAQLAALMGAPDPEPEKGAGHDLDGHYHCDPAWTRWAERNHIRTAIEKGEVPT